MKFGFLIDNHKFDFNGFSIKTVPEYDEIIDNFYETSCVSDGWIYGAETELKKSREEEKFKQRGPITCSSHYSMEATHEIKSTSITNKDHLRFLILGYGFLQGLYLTPEDHFYLWRTRYKPGELHGLILCTPDRTNGMEKINHFYNSSAPKERTRMFAIIHWFLIGHSYKFEWDKFNAQYKVLDGLFKLSGLSASFHAKRPVILAEKYDIILPKWAEIIDGNKKSELSILRNELVHEAKYAGHPIGYSHTDTH